MLCMEDTGCVRSGRLLFSGISLVINPGSFTVLRGRNGSGKTSLLQIMAGLRPPSRGKVAWGQEAGIAWLGHANALKLNLSVIENLMLWAGIGDTGLMVPAALYYWGLAEMARKPCGELSAGWQRRVALARVMASGNKAWLLDEPESHLDEEGQLLLFQMITSRINQGGIVIMASHREIPITPYGEVQLEKFLLDTGKT